MCQNCVLGRCANLCSIIVLHVEETEKGTKCIHEFICHPILYSINIFSNHQLLCKAVVDMLPCYFFKSRGFISVN